MKTRNGIRQRLAAACVIAFGIAILWGLAVGWIANFARTLLPVPKVAYQSLSVTFDGTPVIATQSTEDSTITVERRTLDGKPWPLDYEYWLSNAYFHRPYKPPGVVYIPPKWSDYYGRIVGGTDGKLPPTAWYFIRDDQPNGHVYAAGFDAFSKLPVGYLGRNGFSATEPPLSDRWVVPNIVSNEFFRVLFSTQNLDRRSIVRYHSLWDGGTPPQWFVYLLEADQLWEVDLRERTSRSVAKFNGAMGIDRLLVSEATFNEFESKVAAQPATSMKASETAAEKAVEPAADSDEPSYASLSVVREPDRLVFFDLPTGKRQNFLLPEKLLDRRFSVFMLSGNQLLIFAHEQEVDEYWSGGPLTHLYWTDREGNITREEEVKLAGWVPSSPRTTAWAASALIPVALVWIIGMLVGGPLYVLQINAATSFTAALARVFGYAWPALILVLVVSIVLAILTVRLQRKYRRPATGAWTVFVFLFGVAGFITYWLAHRRPELESCPECHKVVPRDRDACASCHAPFPGPQPVGTEIFA